MNPPMPLNAYLNIKQYNAICKYWRIIEKYKSKIDNLHLYLKYKDYNETSDDEEMIAECVEHNNRIDKHFEKLKGQLNYYEQEYANYVNKIGYTFNDQTQNEYLFNLLNNGILL
jgi:hypothetical protein